MLVRFFFVHEDLQAMFNSTHMGFEHCRQVVSKLDDKAREIQTKKEELFIDISIESLEKHFPRWASPELLPAALLSECGVAVIVAACITKAHDCGFYCWPENKFFHSEVHGQWLRIKDFGIFLNNCIQRDAECS